MNKTKIEWALNPDGTPGYTWNPITGCLHGCEYCYARKLANGRLKARYLANKTVLETACPVEDGRGICFAGNDDPSCDICKTVDPFYPRFWPERFKDLTTIGNKSPRGIFVCDMSDLFGVGVPEEWTRNTLEAIGNQTRHRFYLLTKQPQNLAKWSPFPENCWVGVSVTNGKMADDAGYYLEEIQAKLKFLSIEPLLERTQIYFGKPGIQWLIVGALTCSSGDRAVLSGKYPDLITVPHGKGWALLPDIEWVREIVEAADRAGIPVFEKDNLKPLLQRELIQELPCGK